MEPSDPEPRLCFADPECGQQTQTPDEMEQLAGLKNLVHLNRPGRAVTDKGVAKLRAALPKCKQRLSRYCLRFSASRVLEQKKAVKNWRPCLHEPHDVVAAVAKTNSPETATARMNTYPETPSWDDTLSACLVTGFVLDRELVSGRRSTVDAGAVPSPRGDRPPRAGYRLLSGGREVHRAEIIALRYRGAGAPGTDQTKTVVSSLPERRRLPSGENATARIRPRCPENWPIVSPISRFHTRTT